MEAEAGQGLFQALWNLGSQIFKEGLGLLGLLGGEGLPRAGPAGTRGLLCQGRNVAHLGVQNSRPVLCNRTFCKNRKMVSHVATEHLEYN